MMRAALIAAAAWLACGCAAAEPRMVSELDWRDVGRVVAIGDLHGDHDQFIKVLEGAGLINRRGRWTGGTTHLVQTGDITDRGADSREIIDDLRRLAREAEKAGGRVHTLIGNHEAMNTYGDLRYVHPGEYEAFADRGSERLRDRYYDGWMAQLKETDPAAYGVFELTEGHREQWMAEHPLGWVEHRMAWHPTGEYGGWVLEQPVAVRINDTLFLHGGLSSAYCEQGPQALTDAVHQALNAFNPDDPGVLTDENGPLWYRGLADGDETEMAGEVSDILDCAGVARIVVGHTPTGGVIWPRFDGQVVVIDTGIAAHYGGHAAWLELAGENARAGYPFGSFDLPSEQAARVEYLRAMIEQMPENAVLQRLMRSLTEPVAAPLEAIISEPPEAPDSGR